MIASSVIMSFSLAMFVYWFRYSCILILQSDWNEEQAKAMADRNGLSFGFIEESLADASSAKELDRVRDLLDRDLQSVLNLMSNCESLRETGRSLESRILMLDFHLIKAWYAVTRTVAGPKAQQALREMARIVGYMAGELGDHLATART